MDKVYNQIYINLPKEVRQHLKKVFGIIPTGIAEIRDQEIISDGVSNRDLEVITAEKMTEYVGSIGTFGRLWELTLAKIHYELHPPIDLNPSVDIVTHATEYSTSEFIQIPERTLNSPIPITTINPEVMPTVVDGIQSGEIEVKENEVFCDKCTSKGVRHLKDCPNKTF